MGIVRPATPGFLVTLVATVLLAVVSFCVPYFKSIFFLKANINVDGFQGFITFGTLGYCLNLNNGTYCSTPSVGYQLDINALVGNDLPIEIPQVAVKWITYALVLHLVALGLAAVSAVFGLLAHVREMSMTCCSTCVSGFAAAVSFLAFIFDIALFFIAKSRINAVGSAEMGNAIWLTLAAWILLFFSGCFYTLGRCCISKRRYKGGDWGKADERTGGDYAEQMRLDAVRAETSRKAYQAANNKKEQGLPPMPESQPLTAIIEGDRVYVEGYNDQTKSPRPQSKTTSYSGGYAPAAPGSRAADDYHNQSPQPVPAYPPRQNTPQQAPRRQQSGYAQPAHALSNYSNNAPRQPRSPPPPNTYLAPYANDQYGHEYGHSSGGSSYHTASASAHSQQPTGYSQYDNYTTPSPAPQSQPYQQFNYNSAHASADYGAPPYASYYTSPANAQPTPPHERSYTLGGSGYVPNSGPPLPEQPNPYLTPQTHQQYSSGGTQPYSSHAMPAPVTDLPLTSSPPPVEAMPPVYDAGVSGVQGRWAKQ